MSWDSGVRKVVPYTPGEQPKRTDIIKLNTNECPYPPAPGVEEKLAAMDMDSFRLYPDPEASALVNVLAEYYQVDPEQVFVGIGSDDVLAMAFMTFFNSGKPILFPDITYSFYDVWAELYRIPYQRVPLDAEFRIHKEDYIADNGGIVIANPNAPTGLMAPLSEIEEIIAANRDSVVIVDEAYVDFGGESALPLLKKYDNLLVVQTFSKSRSMAGMRIGFAIGNQRMIGYLKDAKFSFNSYTMNRPSLEMGTAAVTDDAYFKETCGKIIATRERIKKELSALGFSFPDSRTNFIFATHERVPARELFEALKAEGIFVRYFDKPRIDNYLRITIGTDAQMDRLIAFLKDYLAVH
ncbi:MAG: histidinol-phosphate transaminase [Lachnospiraceae bacterium]|nr:histidinol-phosphate transaminase [Lachnospiraceae bacterium]